MTRYIVLRINCDGREMLHAFLCPPSVDIFCVGRFSSADLSRYGKLTEQ